MPDFLIIQYCLLYNIINLYNNINNNKVKPLLRIIYSDLASFILIEANYINLIPFYPNVNH